MDVMERLKQSFIIISKALLYALIASLSVHLYLSQEYGTIYAVLLILLAISRAIVLTLSFADIIRDKIRQPMNDDE